MPATQLQLYQVGSYPYPYATTGTGSALTVCRRYNDPYLAFLTQTSNEDEIVFLYLHSSAQDPAMPALCLQENLMRSASYHVEESLIFHD